MVHAVGWDDPSDPQILFRDSLPWSGSDRLDGTDAEVCDSWVAVGADNLDSPYEGKVYIYVAYQDGEMRRIHDITGSTSFTICSNLVRAMW